MARAIVADWGLGGPQKWVFFLRENREKGRILGQKSEVFWAFLFTLWLILRFRKLLIL
jgi:hypothetical protein